MARPPELTRERFKQWLKDNPDLEFTPNDSAQCPIAVFLGSECDHIVEAASPSITIDGREFDCPAWAADFMDDVDALGREPITARRALTLL